MKKLTSLSLLVFAGMMNIGNVALAQELEELETGTVVISATRTEQMLEDVPVTMEVITSEEIEKIGATNLYDALSTSFGLNTTNVKSSLSFRGFGFSTPVILINGRKPARLEDDHDGPGFYLNSIGLGNIERIEIIRGQAGTMYGANAIAGVMNIITKESVDGGGQVSFTGGNAGLTTNVFYDFGRFGTDDKWDAIFSSNAVQEIAIREESVTPNSNEWSETDRGHKYSVNLTGGYNFNDNYRLGAEAGYIAYDDESRSYNGSTVTLSDTRRQNFNGAILYDGETENHMFSATPYITHSRHNASSKEYWFTTAGVDAQDTWFFNDMNMITIGGEYFYETFAHSTYPNLKDDSIHRTAIYVQDEISLLNEKLFLVPSVRLDYDTQFGAEPTFRLGGTYEFLPDHRIKANIGTAYVAPTLTDVFGERETGTSIVRGNENINPETGFAYELRYEGGWKNIAGSLGYFRTEIKDRIGTQQIGYDDSTRITDPTDFANSSDPLKNINGYARKELSMAINDGKATYQGIEAELNVTFLDDFVFGLGYTWLDNRNTTDNIRLAWYATDTLTASLTYNNYDWGLNARIWGSFNNDFTTMSNDGKDSNGNTHNSYGDPYVFDYYNVNFAVSKVWVEKYTTTLGVYNLLTTSRDTTNDGSVAPLEVHATISMKF